MCVYRCNMSVYDTDEGSIWWYNGGKNWQKILTCRMNIIVNRFMLIDEVSDLGDIVYPWIRSISMV